MAKARDTRDQGARLTEYRRKRDFAVTPEPAGHAAAQGTRRPLEFVVQKHRATRLHYDFRLEHRGVMLSWAIPKGPSFDPAVKRLAVETEPHPMDYNQFEGVIPEGEYGGGVVMIWDRGIWAPVTATGLGTEADVDRQLEKGDLKLVLLGEKLSGSWVLVRTRGPRDWLMIKHRDEYASDQDVVATKGRSVVSGRTMAEIASAGGASPRQLEKAAAADPAPSNADAAHAAPRPARPGQAPVAEPKRRSAARAR